MLSESANKNSNGNSLKFLCSYGGKILPRSVDGELRYVGGHTRVLSVNRSIFFAELMVKICEFCGYSVELRCQLPNGDLETLISIKSDEELANLIEEYDRCCPGSKIRAVLSPPKSLKPNSPASSSPSSVDSSPTSSMNSGGDYRRYRNSCSPPTRLRGGYRNCRRVCRVPQRVQERSGYGYGLLSYDARCLKNFH